MVSETAIVYRPQVLRDVLKYNMYENVRRPVKTCNRSVIGTCFVVSGFGNADYFRMFPGGRELGIRNR